MIPDPQSFPTSRLRNLRQGYNLLWVTEIAKGYYLDAIMHMCSKSMQVL
jgi:hypothetical protein